MNNIITINIKDITSNYIDSISEFIKDSVRANDFKEVHNLTQELSQNVVTLMSCYDSRLREHLADMFFKGSTAMMLADKFSQLEDWHVGGEDYLLVVTGEGGKTIAAFTSSQLDW